MTYRTNDCFLFFFVILQSQDDFERDCSEATLQFQKVTVHKFLLSLTNLTKLVVINLACTGIESYLLSY